MLSFTRTKEETGAVSLYKSLPYALKGFGQLIFASQNLTRPRPVFTQEEAVKIEAQLTEV